jgi:hypothetical protein
MLCQSARSVCPRNFEEVRAILQTAWLFATQSNVNSLANHLSQMLTNELVGAGIEVPVHYVGVFPTATFNAHCDIYNGTRLVLLASGAFEMVEAGVILLLCKKPDIDYACRTLYDHMKAYVLSRNVPSTQGLGKKYVQWSSKLLPLLINAAEHFLIAHELGHLVLGHLNAGEKRMFPFVTPHYVQKFGFRSFFRRRANLTAASDSSRNYSAIATTPSEEFQADLWAVQHLLKRAESLPGDVDAQLEIACAGPAVVLGLAHLFEGTYTQQYGSAVDDGHPPALERWYMVQCLFELLGTHHAANTAYNMNELVRITGKRFIPGFQMPPYLSRDLNRKLVPELEALGISVEHAPYLRDFN